MEFNLCGSLGLWPNNFVSNTYFILLRFEDKATYVIEGDSCCSVLFYFTRKTSS